MGLDIELPAPPNLTNRGRPRDFEWDEETLGTEDFYREDIEDLLQEGAWGEGVREWAEHTDLETAHLRVIDELGLFQAVDLYWDPTEDRLRFAAPAMPDDWRAREASADLDSTAVSAIDGALQDLGRTVHERLRDYLERDDVTTGFGWGTETDRDRET